MLLKQLKHQMSIQQLPLHLLVSLRSYFHNPVPSVSLATCHNYFNEAELSVEPSVLQHCPADTGVVGVSNVKTIQGGADQWVEQGGAVLC